MVINQIIIKVQFCPEILPKMLFAVKNNDVVEKIKPALAQVYTGAWKGGGSVIAIDY